MAKPKTCSVCGDPVGPRNRTGLCKRCRTKAYYEKNKEVIAAWSKDYNSTRKEDKRAYDKVYKEDNKESIKAKRKAYYEENKEYVDAMLTAYYEENKEYVDARSKAYYEKNKEAIAAKRKVYNKKNKEAIAARDKVYYVKNKEAIAARDKVYYVKNIVKIAARTKVWREENKDHVRQYRREHPQEKRTYILSFGDPDCYVWNKWFEGSEGHHLAWNEGIYIPKDMHRSVSHSINQDRNMDVINALVMDWLNGVRRESPQTTLEAFV